MTQNAVLLDIFEHPSTLFKDIVSNIKTLSISPAGIITFSMPMGNRNKSFTFQAQEKMNPEDKLIRMMSQMKLENEQRFRRLEEEIKVIRKEMKDKVEVSKH